MLSAFLKQEVDLSNITISNEQKTNILSNTNENDLPVKNNEDYSEEEILEILKTKNLSFLKSILTDKNIIDFLSNEN
jgi:hypothetical protein